jgi:hypothetical protein
MDYSSWAIYYIKKRAYTKAADMMINFILKKRIRDYSKQEVNNITHDIAIQIKGKHLQKLKVGGLEPQ